MSNVKRYSNDDSVAVMPRIVDPNLGITKESILASSRPKSSTKRDQSHLMPMELSSPKTASTSPIRAEVDKSQQQLQSHEDTHATKPTASGWSLWKKCLLVGVVAMLIGVLVWVVYKWVYRQPSVESALTNPSATAIGASGGASSNPSLLGDSNLDNTFSAKKDEAIQGLSKFIVSDSDSDSESGDEGDGESEHPSLTNPVDTYNVDIDPLESMSLPSQAPSSHVIDIAMAVDVGEDSLSTGGDSAYDNGDLNEDPNMDCLEEDARDVFARYISASAASSAAGSEAGSDAGSDVGDLA